MSAILLLVAEVVAMLPSIIDAGMDASKLFAKTKTVIDENKVPGDVDWDELDATVKRLQAKVRDKSGDV